MPKFKVQTEKATMAAMLCSRQPGASPKPVDGPGRTGWETQLKHIVTAGVGSHLPRAWLAGSAVQCCAAVLQKPALPSPLQLGYSQQKFICLIKGKYERTSSKMKYC